MTNLIDTELKPCPFCGGETHINRLTKTKETRRVEGYCKACGLRFSHMQCLGFEEDGVVWEAEESFETLWNRRTDNG